MKVVQQRFHVGVEFFPVDFVLDGFHVVELADLPAADPGVGVADHGEGLAGIDDGLQADPGGDALLVGRFEEREALADRRGWRDSGGLGDPALPILDGVFLEGFGGGDEAEDASRGERVA